MTSNDNVTEWIELVKAGDSAAASQLWRHYSERLIRAVRAKLYDRERIVSDEEDIVLSVFDSFYDAAQRVGRRTQTFLICWPAGSSFICSGCS